MPHKAEDRQAGPVAGVVELREAGGQGRAGAGAGPRAVSVPSQARGGSGPSLAGDPGRAPPAPPVKRVPGVCAGLGATQTKLTEVPSTLSQTSGFEANASFGGASLLLRSLGGLSPHNLPSADWATPQGNFSDPRGHPNPRGLVETQVAQGPGSPDSAGVGGGLRLRFFCRGSGWCRCCWWGTHFENYRSAAVSSCSFKVRGGRKDPAPTERGAPGAHPPLGSYGCSSNIYFNSNFQSERPIWNIFKAVNLFLTENNSPFGHTFRHAKSYLMT